MFPKKSSLIKDYHEATGKHPDCRWSEQTLIEKITQHCEKKAQDAAIAAERERNVAAAQAAREARIAERGDFAEYARHWRLDDNPETAQLARAALWAVGVIERHEETVAKLAKEFAENPAHAMSWSMEYFSHAADYEVAQSLKGLFDGGATVKVMVDTFTRDMRLKAAYPARSTSPVSNLVEQERLRALNKILGYLDGSEFF